MKLNVNVFEYLNQRVMYVEDINYNFALKNDYEIALGKYQLSDQEILNIAKDNDPEEYEVFTRTSIRERMNKIGKYDIKTLESASSSGVATLCLHPSRRCNLNCKYCFRESEYLGTEQLTIETARDAIDFLIDKYLPQASKYVIDLSGSGEPLLQFELLKQIVEYCKVKRNQICKTVEIMFCTNLTMATPEMIEYIDNEPLIIPGVSIDGDELTNDNNRVYINGNGTYQDIVKKLSKFKNKKFGFAVTVTPLNQNVDEIYDSLYKLPSMDCISMKYIRSFDKSAYDFSKFDVKYLTDRYEKLCENILLRLKNGDFNYLKKLLQGADYFGCLVLSNVSKGGYKVYRCDAGKERITVNSKGDIFSCSVMYGNDDFRIGNIYNGLIKSQFLKFHTVYTDKTAECKQCPIVYKCGGECYVNAYLKNGNIYQPLQKMCEIKIELNKLAMAFVNLIKEEYPDVYKQLVDFSFEVNGYDITKYSIWSVMYYLKEKHINVDYGDVSDYIYNNPDRDSPIGVLNFLKRFNPDTDAYEIDNPECIDEIPIPAIAVLNKATSNVYDYAVLTGKQGNNILFKTLFTDTDREEMLPLCSFINKMSSILIF